MVKIYLIIEIEKVLLMSREGTSIESEPEKNNSTSDCGSTALLKEYQGTMRNF